MIWWEVVLYILGCLALLSLTFLLSAMAYDLIKRG